MNKNDEMLKLLKLAAKQKQVWLDLYDKALDKENIELAQVIEQVIQIEKTKGLLCIEELKKDNNGQWKRLLCKK